MLKNGTQESTGNWPSQQKNTDTSTEKKRFNVRGSIKGSDYDGTFRERLCITTSRSDITISPGGRRPSRSEPTTEDGRK